MMNTLRYRAKAILVVIVPAIIISFVIAIFAVWGAQGSLTGNNPDTVALIGKEPVTYTELSTAWQNRLQQLNEEGKTFSEGEEKKLKRELLDLIIERKLALGYAKKLGIMASDEETAQSIMGERAFMTNGKFDKEKYMQILYNMKVPQNEFEESQRETILLSKFRNMLYSDVKVTDDELKGYYLKRNRTIQTDYVYFNYKNFLKDIKISDDKMKDYYAVNKKNYEKPERVKASHILIRPDASPTSPTGLTDEGAKKMAEDVLAKLKAGQDFATLAKKYSADPGSGNKGGDLGWFSKGQMVPEFEKAAFALGKGATSGLIKTQFGYHIIKVTDKDKGFEATFDKVKDKIKAELEKQEGMKLADAKCDTFLKDTDAGEEFTKAASKEGVSLRTTPMFGPDTKLSEIESEDFKKTIFDMPKGSISSKIDGTNGYYVFDIKNEKVPAFNEAKYTKDASTLENGLRSIKFKQLYDDTIETLKKAGNVKYFEKNL
jgi:peptidyl-prolyl cis-trans isomerase D